MNLKNTKSISLQGASKLMCDFSTNVDGNYLLVEFSGSYREGSLGNNDGLYMFSMIAAHYLIFEPICIVLDLRKLEYRWGNTILKTINFFSELGRDADERAKKMIILTSGNTFEALNSLEVQLTDGNRAYCQDIGSAMALVEREIEEYLKGPKK